MKGAVPDHVVSCELFEVFRSLRHRPFLVMDSTGNYGDELIGLGGRKLLRDAGVDFRQVPPQSFLDSTDIDEDLVIYIHGSGGFVPMWSGTPIRTFCHALTHHAGTVILGPTTAFDEGFLRGATEEPMNRRICERVITFARERTTHAFMQAVFPADVDVRLDHDTAFNITREDLVDQPTESFRRHRRFRGGYTYYAIRRDKEQRGAYVRKPFSVWVDPVPHCSHFGHWIEIHRAARSIITNRTHSAIVGNILGLPVSMLPNSYHKNRSIWEFSLEGRGVLWLDELPRECRAPGPLLTRIPLFSRIQNSRHAVNVVLKMRGAR